MYIQKFLNSDTGKYLMSILAWHADFQINDFDPDRWLRDHPAKS